MTAEPLAFRRPLDPSEAELLALDPRQLAALVLELADRVERLEASGSRPTLDAVVPMTRFPEYYRAAKGAPEALFSYATLQRWVQRRRALSVDWILQDGKGAEIRVDVARFDGWYGRSRAERRVR